MNITLHPILKDGTVENISTDNEYLRGVIPMTLALYEKVGFISPWISYVSVFDGIPVSVGAFKSPPVDGRVEIAYFTFPPNENKGIATETAKALIAIAQKTDPQVTVFAQTLPQKSASTRILEKLNLQKTREVTHPEDGNVWEWELGNPHL